MTRANHELISALHDLIETCEDSEEGFRHAARRVQDSERRALFESCSQQAARFAAELEGELRRLGGSPDDADIYSGLANPGWVTITGKLTEEDEAAILAECECGVDAADKSYSAALEKGMPDEVRSLVERQHLAVREIGARIHALGGHHPFGVRPPCGDRKRERSLSGDQERRDGFPTPGSRSAAIGTRREPAAPARLAPPG